MRKAKGDLMPAFVHEQDYTSVALNEVCPHPENPRRGDVDALEASIDANGFYGALVVQRSTGHIVVGNHRFLAAQKAGIAELPALFIDVDDERAKRIMLVDNRAADLAGWDEDALHAMLAELSVTDTELEGTLYTHDEFEQLVMDSSPQPRGDGSLLAKADVTLGPPDHQVARGEVWHVGPHVLACADVLVDWPLWSPYLTGDDLVFAPYPSPYLPFSDKLEGRRLLMVQPNIYLAGHLLDKWTAITDTPPKRVEVKAA